jgi:hypothetical protein
MRCRLVQVLRGVLVVSLATITRESLAQSVATPVTQRARRPELATATPERALRLTSTTARIVLDGRASSGEWDQAGSAADFVQQFPQAGSPASERTEVRVHLDESALYVLMRLLDDSVSGIVAPIGRRDAELYSDWAHVLVDSYHDRRTAFRFAVNPSGVQRDALIAGDTEWNEDAGWDAVWQAVTSRDSSGWTAEFRIPLSQLRFSGGDAPGTWGIQFGRHLARRNERSYWSGILPERNGFVSQFGRLEGVRVQGAPRRLEIVPYSVAQLSALPSEAGNPFAGRHTRRETVGTDLRVGVTSDFTLTATVNPDFGQVEADPSEVNLSGSETFFSERRPFFLEGAELFQHALSDASWIFGEEQLFYSRRIGRAPQVDAPEAAAWEDRPATSPIRGALKLTGKTRRGWSLALMSALTGEAESRLQMDDGSYGRVLVEPRTHYGFARFGRDFARGDGSLGGVVTMVHRDPSAPTLRSRAVVAGIDGRRRFGGGNYVVAGYVMQSDVAGTPAAITETQESTVHLFQRPDAEHLRLDSTRTSLGGYASELRLVKSGGGNIRWGLVGHFSSPGFETNDLGYLPRADQKIATGWIGWMGHRPSRFTRSWSLWTNYWGGWDYAGDRLRLGHNVWASAELHNFWRFEGQLVRDLPAMNPIALRGGPALRMSEKVGGELRVISDARRAVGANVQVRAFWWPATEGRFLSAAPQVTARVGTRGVLSVTPSLSVSTPREQWVDDLRSERGTRYLVGQLEHTTASVTGRLDLAFTPRLTLQLYAQPFVSTGRFQRLGTVVNARARRLEDRVRYFAARDVTRDGVEVQVVDAGETLRFEDPDFSVGELRSNAVMRWEYRQGSALYLVWSHGREHEPDRAYERLRQQATGLWSEPGTNVLAIKVSHWIGR